MGLIKYKKGDEQNCLNCKYCLCKKSIGVCKSCSGGNWMWKPYIAS